VLNENKLKKIGILDWLIFLSIIIMALMIYLPQNIWEEESEYKKLRREKMEIISNAEEFFYELTGKYTLDTDELFFLVESAMDSLIADSLFIGSQTIELDDKIYNVNIEQGFHVAVDTTFSSLEIIKYAVMDTIFTISTINKETNLLDTMLVNSRSFNKYKKDDSFKEVISYETENRTEKSSNYLRRKFHLSNELTLCPISKNNMNTKFILSIEKDKNNESIFKITSPVSDDHSELRYGIFTYNPGKEESISGGMKSWAEK
jgi:hypothetical protein